MTSTRIATTVAAQSVVLTEALTTRGWTAKRSEVRDACKVTQTISLTPPLGSAPVRLMIATYPENGGQLVEFISEPTRGTGKSSTGSRFYWRLSVFDAPQSAILAAARTALACDHGATFDTAAYEGWETCHLRSSTDQLVTSTFVHPTGQVTATYHYPTAPGECGGWLICAPDSYADASGHTPGPVIRELAENLFTR